MKYFVGWDGIPSNYGYAECHSAPRRLLDIAIKNPGFSTPRFLLFCVDCDQRHIVVLTGALLIIEQGFQ